MTLLAPRPACVSRLSRKNGTDEQCTELPGTLRPAAPPSVDAAANRLVDLVRQFGRAAAREYWERSSPHSETDCLGPGSPDGDPSKDQSEGDRA